MKEFLDKCEGGSDMEVQTFTLTITSRKYDEWQGRLVGEDNYEVEFRSVMEFIKAISKKMEPIEKMEKEMQKMKARDL